MSTCREAPQAHGGTDGRCQSGTLASNESKRRAAEHAHAADRCAREIVGFLTGNAGALAAADGQGVGR